MKIIYDTHRGGNTTYASLDKQSKKMLLSRISINFYKMLEDSYSNPEIAQLLLFPDSVYKKNSQGNYNCMQSFLAGVLGQHAADDRDFSVWQLEGLSLASRVFNHYYNCGEIEFEKGKPSSDTGTLIDNHPLFDK